MDARVLLAVSEAKEAEPRCQLITKMADAVASKRPLSESGSEDSERSSIRNG